MINEWCVFTAKLHSTRGRVLWRSFAFCQHITPLKFLNYHNERVRDAEARLPERVGTYNSTHFATVPEGMRLTSRELALDGDAQAAENVVAAPTPCTRDALGMGMIGRVDQGVLAAGDLAAMRKARRSFWRRRRIVDQPPPPPSEPSLNLSLRRICPQFVNVNDASLVTVLRASLLAFNAHDRTPSLLKPRSTHPCKPMQTRAYPYKPEHTNNTHLYIPKHTHVYNLTPATRTNTHPHTPVHIDISAKLHPHH